MVASAGYLAKHGAPKTPEDLEFHELLGGNDLVNGRLWSFLRNNERVLVPIHSKLRLKRSYSGKNRGVVRCRNQCSRLPLRYFGFSTPQTTYSCSSGMGARTFSRRPASSVGRKPTSAVEALCDFISEKWRSNPELIFLNMNSKNTENNATLRQWQLFILAIEKGKYP